jgi:hypothetical protein
MPKPTLHGAAPSDPKEQLDPDLKWVADLAQSISRMFARFDIRIPEIDRAALDALGRRIDFALALRDALEALSRDPRTQDYPPGQEVLRKVLETLPGPETPISQCHSGRIAEALAAPGLRREQRRRARGLRKKDGFERAKAMYQAAIAPGSQPLSKAARLKLKKRIFDETGVAQSTVRRWLADLESSS